MNIARILLASAVAVAAVAASGSARLGAETRESEDIKLSGCLVRGEDRINMVTPYEKGISTFNGWDEVCSRMPDRQGD